MSSPWRPMFRHEDIPPGWSLMSIRQPIAGSCMAWRSAHHTFASLPFHLDVPRFSPSAFVHWTRWALAHDEGLLQAYKPRDGRSTPLFWRAGICWSRVVVFEDSIWFLLHFILFIVWYPHIPFCFHGNSYKFTDPTSKDSPGLVTPAGYETVRGLKLV
jgi:hypothetical protein